MPYSSSALNRVELRLKGRSLVCGYLVIQWWRKKQFIQWKGSPNPFCRHNESLHQGSCLRPSLHDCAEEKKKQQHQNQSDRSPTKIHYIIRAETFQSGPKQLTDNATSLVRLKQIHCLCRNLKIPTVYHHRLVNYTKTQTKDRRWYVLPSTCHVMGLDLQGGGHNKSIIVVSFCEDLLLGACWGWGSEVLI